MRDAEPDGTTGGLGAPGRCARGPGGLTLFIVATAAVTGVLVICLALGIPTVQRLPWWFWKMNDKHCFLRALGVAALVAAPLVGLCRLRPRSRLSALAAGGLALCAGCTLQHGLALAEGRGADGLRDRVLHSGHREFAVTATRGYPAGIVLRQYEELVRGRGQTFARSKPPGQLLLYMAMARVAQTVMPAVWHPHRPASFDPQLWNLANFAVLVFPFLSYLVLLPLVYLGTVFLGLERAHWPALAYVVVPPTALVTLHMDQVLYPLLATGLWALAVAAARRSRAVGACLWAATGLWAWTAVFVSFSLLPAVPIAAALAWEASPHKVWTRFAVGWSLALAAFALAALAMRLAFAYDMTVAFGRALENHRVGKRWNDAMRLPAALSTLCEFGYWLGVPVLAAFVAAGADAVVRAIRTRAAVGVGTAGVLATWIATAGAGTTYAEVARLWIFFVPAMVLLAAGAVGRWTHGSGRSRGWDAVLVLQLLWTVALKNWQDF